MMQIMHFGLVVEEIISTMYSHSVEEFERQKYPECQYMAVEQLRWQRNWQGIGEDLLDRMGELSGQSDRCRKAVMLLMNAHIEVWYMQQAMTVIEQSFAHQQAEDHVAYYFDGAWEGFLDAV